VKNSLSSAWKTPSATNLRFLLIWVAILCGGEGAVAGRTYISRVREHVASRRVIRSRRVNPSQSKRIAGQMAFQQSLGTGWRAFQMHTLRGCLTRAREASRLLVGVSRGDGLFRSRRVGAQHATLPLPSSSLFFSPLFPLLLSALPSVWTLNE
jgi:hypothetical protein